MQLRARKSHLLSSTASDAFQVPTSGFKQQATNPRRSLISNAWLQARIYHYRFETTFGPYVMDTGEKVAFYLVFFLVLLSVIMLVYYVLSFLVSRTAPSMESTVREFLNSEMPKLRVEPAPSREYQRMRSPSPAIVAL